MKIIIDEREVSLYEKCISVVQTNNLNTISVIKEVLPLGDIIFKTNEDSLICIIERKSLNDLMSSIKDGRYEEQSHRLSHNGCLLYTSDAADE